MASAKDAIKTGTTTLGIVCSDGIVIAADKRTTQANWIADRKAEKVITLVDDTVVTTAGVASETDRLVKLARAELKLVEVRTSRKVTVKEASNLFAALAYAAVRQLGEWGVTEFIVAGKDSLGFNVYHVYIDGHLKKCEDFVTSGSGGFIINTILEDKYKKGLSIQEGIRIAVEAINAAQLRDSASGSGFDVYTITKEGLRKVLTKDLTVKAEI